MASADQLQSSLLSCFPRLSRLTRRNERYSKMTETAALTMSDSERRIDAGASITTDAKVSQHMVAILDSGWPPDPLRGRLLKQERSRNKGFVKDDPNLTW